MVDKIKQYASEVVTEMKKVTWPSQEELKESTIVVLTVSGLLALFTFVTDETINFVIKQLVKLG
ncbi:MAG: preprotein translocase subunit SecE [Chloroherpetonaceae bacterium]|nr:preprotein translocase subunit SecE [Chloroherpetonaceae bacterium]